MATPYPLWTADEICQVTAGQWLTTPAENLELTGVCYYRGQVKPGDIVLTTNPTHWDQKYEDTRPHIAQMFKSGAALVISELAIETVENARG